RQGRVDLVLDLDQRVQDHRPALVEVDLVGVGARVLAVVRVPAVHLEGAHAGCTGRRLEVAALADLRVLREGEFGHLVSSGNRESRIGSDACGAWWSSRSRAGACDRSGCHSCPDPQYTRATGGTTWTSSSRVYMCTGR